MANTIVNKLSIKGENSAVSKAYNLIKRDTDVKKFGVGVIDFNKVILMPKEICELEDVNGCAEEDYFIWTNKHWGSKGNACGISGKVNAENSIWFETSGGSARKVIEKLSEMFPDLEFELSSYDDFDLGNNVQKCIYKNALVSNETKLNNGDKEAFEFVLALEECTPDKKGLIYNPEIDNYEYSMPL